ncbi:MAG: type II toxin-antitoxin system VapC family toxin, partial [Anaerolineales bacterium]
MDSSALSKRHLAEGGSAEVEGLVAGADKVGTSIITRVEVSAALARARRQNLLDERAAVRLRILFSGHWASLFRLNLLANT